MEPLSAFSPSRVSFPLPTALVDSVYAAIIFSAGLSQFVPLTVTRAAP